MFKRYAFLLLFIPYIAEDKGYFPFFRTINSEITVRITGSSDRCTFDDGSCSDQGFPCLCIYNFSFHGFLSHNSPGS